MPHQQLIRETHSDTIVLFIHGILGTPDHFKDFIKLLPETISVYNMLLDGHGKTPRDFSETSMKKWKEQVSLTVQKLAAKYDNIIIVAHSMGTLFAVNEGIRYRDKIKALLLLNTPLSVNVKPSAVKNGLKIVFEKEEKDDVILQAMKDGCSIELDKKLYNYFGWLPRYVELLAEISKTKEILPMLDIPCYIFQSKNDELVSEKSHNFFKTNPEITYYLLKNSCHFHYSDEDKKIMLNEFKKIISTYCDFYFPLF